MPELENLSLAGRVALVTGGTQGIGLAIARLLRDRGAQLILVGRSVERGEQAGEVIGARFVAADVAHCDTPDILFRLVESEFGKLDILINNAGSLGEPSNVAQTTPDGFDRTIAVHLRAPWFLMSTLLPLLGPGSSIVNVASVAGHRVGATSAAYSVAKSAMLHLTRCAAAEFGQAGIRVNSVSPGFIPTSIHAQALDDDDARGNRLVSGLSRLFLQRQALNQLGSTEDIAELVAFLASDAAGFISGSDMVADGGMMWGRSGLM